MLMNPVKQLGPPHWRLARAGRMNAAGLDECLFRQLSLPANCSWEAELNRRCQFRARTLPVRDREGFYHFVAHKQAQSSPGREGRSEALCGAPFGLDVTPQRLS
jgi:hypothetical protein